MKTDSEDFATFEKVKHLLVKELEKMIKNMECADRSFLSSGESSGGTGKLGHETIRVEDFEEDEDSNFARLDNEKKLRFRKIRESTCHGSQKSSSVPAESYDSHQVRREVEIDLKEWFGLRIDWLEEFKRQCDLSGLDWRKGELH